MHKKRSEQSVEVRENMRGGTGQVTVRHYLKPEEIKARTRLCAELTLAPGASIGLHDHIDEDEIYIIQKGQGLMTNSGSPGKQDEARLSMNSADSWRSSPPATRPSSQGGKEFPVGPGDAILTGQGASHSIKNTGNEDLVVTAIIIKY